MHTSSACATRQSLRGSLKANCGRIRNSHAISAKPNGPPSVCDVTVMCTPHTKTKQEKDSAEPRTRLIEIGAAAGVGGKAPIKTAVEITAIQVECNGLAMKRPMRSSTSWRKDLTRARSWKPWRKKSRPQRKLDRDKKNSFWPGWRSFVCLNSSSRPRAWENQGRPC